jgi:hypothetical protein
LPDNFGKTNESLNLRKGVQRFCECMMSNIAPPFLDDINYHSICIKLCKCLNSFAEHCISGNKKGYLFDIERVREYLSKYPFLHDAIKIPMLPLDQEDLILKNKNRKERMLW